MGTYTACRKEIEKLHPDFCTESINYKNSIQACMGDKPYTVDQSEGASDCPPPEEDAEDANQTRENRVPPSVLENAVVNFRSYSNMI